MKNQADKCFTKLGYTKINDCSYVATHSDEYGDVAHIDLDLETGEFIKYIKKTIDGKQVSIADYCSQAELAAIQGKISEYSYKKISGVGLWD